VSLVHSPSDQAHCRFIKCDDGTLPATAMAEAACRERHGCDWEAYGSDPTRSKDLCGGERPVQRSAAKSRFIFLDYTPVLQGDSAHLE